jgi:hypothetical protein
MIDSQLPISKNTLTHTHMIPLETSDAGAVLSRTSQNPRTTDTPLHHYRLLIFTAYLSPAKTLQA